MKIQKVIIKNFRNIPLIEKEISGHNILLLGENTVGKSNFIKALEISLGLTSVAGVDAVAHGEKEATIQVVTDDKGNKYTFDVKFKQGNDKPVITVTAPNGLKNTTKSVIGSIVGEIDFDIDKFVELSKTEKGRKEQVEIVRSFLPQDAKEELQKHENKIKTMYDDRTDLNRQVKTIEGFIKESDISESDREKYWLKGEGSDALNAEMTKAIVHNTNVDKSNSAKEQCERTINANNATINELKNKITALEVDNELQTTQIVKIDEWQKSNKVIDITELQSKIKEASEFDRMHEKVNAIRTQENRRDELMKESENLTVLIDTTRQLISDTIKDLQMPIEGLSFTEESLTYNGSVVDESTLSTSEIMMLGVKLKMAKNPNVKVLFIERGESLGTAKLKALQQMASEHNFQIIMEQVERGTEELKIEIMPELEPVTA